MLSVILLTAIAWRRKELAEGQLNAARWDPHIQRAFYNFGSAFLRRNDLTLLRENAVCQPVTPTCIDECCCSCLLSIYVYIALYKYIIAS